MEADQACLGETQGKSTGDSTLSVRYCKMKDNFEKAGGKDVSSISGDVWLLVSCPFRAYVARIDMTSA